MASAATASAARRGDGPAVLLVRLALIAAFLAIWEAAARSGLFFQDVVPTLYAIGAAVLTLWADGELYRNLAVTLAEIGAALIIGGGIGIAVGIAVGGSRLMQRAYEPLILYLAPVPKIIFFPIMIMWFGVGPGSKVAMGALSCFFPVAISVAAGMRAIDRVLIRVGRSFRASGAQMVAKIYLPAMRTPILTGIRIGLGIAVIGTLLAETKLSNQGLGYLIIRAYANFNMPRMYALLITVFALAIAANMLLTRLSEGAKRR
jgi:NitT/TauT family transport system permease protein